MGKLNKLEEEFLRQIYHKFCLLFFRRHMLPLPSFTNASFVGIGEIFEQLDKYFKVYPEDKDLLSEMELNFIKKCRREKNK